MRGLKAKFRSWLLGDVQKTMDCLLVQSALVVGTGENLVRLNGLVLSRLDQLGEQVREMRAELASLREEMEKGREGIEVQLQVSRIDSKAATAELKASVDRLVELVTPKAERLQGRRPVGGWDEVLAENAREVQKENTVPGQAR